MSDQTRSSLAVQLLPLPFPPGVAAPADLPIVHAYDAAALAALDRDRVTVCITHSLRGFPAELWDVFPNLALIANLGVGLDRIDLDEAQRRGIHVSYTAHELTADVADLAMGFTLALLRRLPAADGFARTPGAWGQGPFPLAASAGGRKLGILGLGRIGQAIAARAAVFGMVVGYHGRRRHSEVPLAFFDSAVALADWADVLVAALPGGAATDGIVSAEVLAALGERGLFVNVARASIVDEPALVAALAEGRIAGAGLELFDPQSTLPARLAGVDNVLMTPHIGSATRETRTAMVESVFANVRAALAGEALHSLIV